MKIRCVSQSIRLRLRKSDVAKLNDQKRIEETIVLPHAKLVFALGAHPKALPEVSFQNGELLIQISESELRSWMNSTEVGLNYAVNVAGSEPIELLIEKDFPCKDRDEDVSDTYFELDDSDPATC